MTAVLAAVASHAQAILTRADHALLNLGPAPKRGERPCPLCGGELAAPERGGVLVWRRCAKCGKHQVGEQG